MTGPLLLCEADVVVEEATGGQMGEKAEVECAVSLRSGRGLYLSTLTLAVSLLRGSSAIISIAVAHQPIRAQLWASASRESHASGRGMTNKQASWEHKPLLFLQATNSEVTPPTLALHSTLKLVTWHVRTLSEKPPRGTSLLYYRLSTPSPHSACFLSSKPEHFWSVESEDAHKKAASQQAIRND